MSKHFKDDTCSHEINKRRILILQYNIKHSIFTLKIGHLKVLATFGYIFGNICDFTACPVLSEKGSNL